MSRATAAERLGRLLAIVPWVATHDGPSVREVCARFGVGEDELLADLDLLFLCGVHPFTPDTLIEVDVADGRVWIRFADYFRAPLRLTAPEGLALVAAGEALLAVPGAADDGALARALAKLETVLGVGAAESVEVELGSVQAPVLESVRRGAAEGHKVAVSYYSFGRDGSSERTIHPWRVFNHAGQWYVDAWCELVDGRRLFRVDRITAATLTTDTFVDDRPRGDADRQVYAPDAADPVITLDLAPAAHWIAEQYPNEGVEERPDARLRVRLRSGQRAWLERLLLRAGRDAEIVEGDPELRRQAAARVLARYG